ncbi:MAG: ABC transporter ATP-binding protein [Acidimicrobiaceae bacterium]|jgi:molybdate transport system ATP-binding protein|nr:ABC transporter ATP-binding protein [Acidimicrobiaceae bacterium]
MVAGPVTEQPQPLLDTHVVVERGEFLLDVELQVAPGETVAIMGPNGAGKTSFLYALFGWLPLRSGWILLDGVTIEAPGQDQFVSPHHRDFGMVFDDCLLFPHMTVEQNLAFGTNVEIETSPLVELLELSHLLKNRATALSAGQQQRVALARTLLTSPKMVFLDEPLASLDPSGRIQARHLIRSALNDQVSGALIVTHDPADAFALADSVMVLEGGSISQFGSIGEIGEHPATPWIASLIGWNFFAGVGSGSSVQLADGTQIATSESGLTGEVTIAINPSSVALFLEAPVGSPRNKWFCEIETIESVGELARVTLSGPVTIYADITLSAASDLELRKGLGLWVSVKATEVLVQSSNP